MCQNYSLRRFCEEWRIWIRPLLIVTYGIFAIIVVPLLIVNSVKDGFQRRDQLILIGGLFVLSAVPISIWHIIQHVIHFTKPILQKHIIRILWMVPIYALNAVSILKYTVVIKDPHFYKILKIQKQIKYKNKNAFNICKVFSYMEQRDS